MTSVLPKHVPIPRSYPPPAPVPCREPLGLVALVHALMRNPIECWAEEHFEKACVTVGLPLLIGLTFAMQEATLALTTIVHHFRLELAPGHAVWPPLRVTLRPADVPCDDCEGA
jgi:hypothetical protein